MSGDTRRGLCWSWLTLALAVTALPALELPPDAQRQPIHPGAWSFQMRRAAGPYAIDGFLWERAESRLQPVAVGAPPKAGRLEGTSRQATRLLTAQRRAIAAVNADFFIMRGPGQGATIGLFMHEGELLQTGNERPAFVMAEDGSPHIDTFRSRLELTVPGATGPVPITRLNIDRGPEHLVLYTPAWGTSTNMPARGLEVALKWAGRLPANGQLTAQVVAAPSDAGNLPIAADGLVLSASGQHVKVLGQLKPGMSVTIGTKTTPAGRWREAVGGWPVLQQGGREVYTPQAKEPRHPRTAVGYDARHIIAVTVDGRRPGHSVGMTLPELSRLMREFGCQDALNLDGGGSTTCWVRGRILNRPSDGSERRVANALALLSIGPLGTPAVVTFDPPGPVLLGTGATLTPTVAVADALLNPLPEQRGVELRADGDIGNLAGGTLRAGDTPARGRLVAAAPGVAGQLEVTVVDQVATLRPEPSRLELLPGETAELRATGLDANGRPVILAPERLIWTVPAGLGRVEAGRFIAAREGTEGAVTVSGYGASARVPVRVAAPVLVEDFETGATGRFHGVPETVKGSLEPMTGDAASGRKYLRLVFNLGDQATTRAAYLGLDRKLGAAMALRARVRGDGQAVWLRAMVVDGNGTRTTHTLHEGPLKPEWTTVMARLPKGLKAPLVWESVYVVSLAHHRTRDGLVDWDQLEVLR